MSEKNLYKILGVRPDASQAQIRAAYLKLAKQWHPDRNPGNEAEAERRFKEIAHAYDVLSDPEKRAAYDAAAGAGEQTTGFEGTMDDDAAFDLFISVLLDLAFELAENGADQITIYQALIDMGCPSGTGKTLAQKAHKLGGNGKAGSSSGEASKAKRQRNRGNGGNGANGGTKTSSANPIDQSDPDETFLAGPWSRWFARSLDLLIGAAVASPLIGWLFQWLWTLELAPRLVAYFFLIAPIPFIADAIMVGIFGNSLGKALLRIQVGTKTVVDGKETLKPLSFIDALFRNFEIWFKGYWCSIPVLAAVPQFLSYLKVSEGKPVPWDMGLGPKYEGVATLDADDLPAQSIPLNQKFFVQRQKTRWELIAAFVVCAIAAPIVGKVGAELFMGSILNISSPDAASNQREIASGTDNEIDVGKSALNPQPKENYVAEQSQTPTPSEERGYSNVRITFVSNPAGADIYISGIFLGKAPATLDVNYTDKDIIDGYVSTLGGFARWPDGRVSENFGKFIFPIKPSGKASFTFEPYKLDSDKTPDLNPWDNPPLANNPLNPLSGY